MKPAGAPHGHVPVAVVGLGRGHRGHPPGPIDDFTILAMPTGAEQLIQSERHVNID